MRRFAARRPTAVETTVSIPVSSLTVGAQAANAFTGWTSPATTVFQNNTWGASNTKYLSTLDIRYFVAKTTGVSRDQEVSTWGQRSVVYLRLTEAGKAIVFTVSPLNGALEVIIGNVSEGTNLGGLGPAVSQINSGLITPIVSISSVPGYSATSNTGHYWTFGCEGFDIYAKYNGVEFWRTTQFWHLEPGRMAIATQENFGFRDVTATHKVSISTYSDIGSKVFDPRDFGMKSVKTTGAIGAASTSLVVADATGFSVGDQICIATGGEAGGGVPGEQGVGGSWPKLKYATTAAMNADTTQATGKVCGVLANGNVYQWNGTAWVAYFFAISKYLQKILPKAHTATITNIVGTTITIDAATTAAATDAEVYFDNGPLLLLSYGAVASKSGIQQQSGCTLSYPEGLNWVFANTTTSISSIPNIQIIGAGADATRFVVPKGTTATLFDLQNCPNAVVRDFAFVDNCRTDSGYYFTFNATTDVWAGASEGVRLSNCNGAIVSDIDSLNHAVAVATVNFCQDSVIRDINVSHETGHKQYFQWAVNIADSANCIIEDITYDCPNLLKGLETFRSAGSILRRATGRNIIFSSNSSTGFLFEDCDIYYEPGSGDDGLQEGLALSHPDPREPIINLNSNIDNISGSVTGSGGTLRNCNFDVQGRLWTGYGVNLINISAPVNNILIEGQYPDKPVTEPSGLIRLPNLGSDTSQAVRADSNSTSVVVDGIRVITASSLRPVGTLNGGAVPTLMTVRNCVIDNIPSGGTQTNNISNAAYEAL